MKCTGCDFENRDGKRFCVQCGTPLVLRCPGCSAEVEPDERFCGACGTALTGAPAASAAPTARATPTAVRKTVTVLFADLSGSTGFGERNDVEISRQVLARYHALLQETVDAHAGTVAKFMGDGMMATWGIPEVAEDDARRAVAAGVALQQRFEEFAADVERRHGEAMALRVGVNTGEVVIGEGDADLIGDALNVAARLEHACRPGHVLVGEETWRLTRAEVGYTALGELTVAGRAQPVATYEVATETEVQPEVATPFVGRDREMERLIGVFDDARRAAAARLTTVLGSPGVGKTRLSRELCARLAEHGDAASVELRCDRDGEATFAPVAQLIREAAGLGEDLDPGAARAAIGALLDEGEADHARVVDVLAGVVGVGPARSVEETFWGVRRLVEATAATRPLVIVIDDIQWAEPLLLDLIEHLAEWVADAAVLLVGLARPELREVRPSLAEPGRPVSAVVVLDGLDASATEALAAGLLGTERLPAGLVERLPASTDGNPLFVRELVRMLVDDQVIRRRDDGEWVLTIDAEAVDVPPTIQSLLGARVERLPATEREVLEYASVVGAEFSLGALRELAGEGAPITSLLESMRRKELVEPTGTYWGDEPVHRFHHVLIRDAAYRRLLKTTRAELHERVAVWTDRTASDLVGEHEAATAFHYEQAYRYRTELGTADDDTARLARRAAELLTTAAHRALGRDDLASAGALSSRALALLPESDAAARADLLQTGCECLLASGNGAAAKPLVEELGRSADGDARLAAWAECYAAQLVGLTDPEGLVAADARAQAAADVLTELGDGSGQAKAHQVRAGLLARLGRVGDAELELDLALDAARAADDRRRVTAVLGAAPDAALFGPSPVARAGGRCLDVVRLLRITTASPAVEAASNRCQAVLESLRGRFDVSRSMLASARASLEELGLRHGIAQTELYAGMVELIAGDPHAAIPPLRAAYEGLGTLGVGADAGQAAALLATALLAEGEVDEAELMAAESEALAGQNLKTAIGWRVARAEVLAARDDVAAAVALAEEAVEIAAGTDLVIDHADACVALAALRAQAGDAAGAGAARADAKRLYDQKGATVPAERLDRTDGLEIPEPEPAVAAVTSGTVLSAPSNAAAEQLRRAAELFAARRFDECGALCAEDFRIFDRRQVVGSDLIGRAAVVANMEATAELGSGSARFEPIAVRGSTLALGRNVMDFGDWGSSFLALGELGPDGLGARNAWFDEADLDAAIEELDAWYVAGEGVEHAQVLTTNAAFFRALNAFDFDAMRALAGSGFVYVDQRPLGTLPLDLDAFIEWQEGYRGVENHAIVVDIQVRGRVNLVTAVNRAVDADGGEIIWPYLVVGVVDADGRAVRVEAFAPEDWDAALARFDLLAVSSDDDGRTPEIVNASTLMVDRLWSAAAAQRFDEVAAMLAPDVERSDHRPGVALAPISGVEGYVELLRASFGRGEVERVAVTPLGVRGERLSLTRVHVAVQNFEIAVLLVAELDESGRLSRAALYDDDDLAAAVDDLDDRFLAGAVAPDVRVLTVVRSAFRAIRAEDTQALGRLLSPELVTVDHQRIGFGTRDRDAFLHAEHSDLAVMRRDREYSQKGFVSGAAVLVVYESQRLDPYGGEVLYQYHFVATVDASDRIDRMEWFDVDDWDAALARFDELAAGSPADLRNPRAENAGTRAGRAVRRLVEENRLDVAERYFADDYVRIDRRSGVSASDAHGGRAFLDAWRGFYDVGLSNQHDDYMAVRGDRLHLIRSRLGTADGDEVVFLQVVEFDEAGRAIAGVNFDDDDLTGALEELDARYVASGEATDVEAKLLAGAAALNRRDYEALAAQLSPGFVSIDHQPLGFPPVGSEEFLHDHMAGLDAMVPDNVRVVSKLLSAGRAGLMVIRVIGETNDGSRYEWTPIFVSHIGADGLVDRNEAFPPEDWDAALARFDELAGETASDGPGRALTLENAATRVGRRVAGLFTEQRVDDLSALMHPDIVTESRRHVVGTPAGVEWDAVADALSRQFSSATAEPLAVRGDRLAAIRVVLRDDGDNVTTWIALIDVDDGGRITRMTNLDEQDEIAAIDLLDEWHIAGAGAAEAVELSLSRDGMRMYHARDWDAMRAQTTDDFQLVDHRPLGWPLADADGWIRLMQERVAQVPDMHCAVRRMWWRNRVGLSLLEVMGTDPGGGRFSWPSLQISGPLSSDGRNPRIEYFPLDDVAAAFARFDELAGSTPAQSPSLHNSAMRYLEAAREFSSMPGRDVDDFAAQWLADDVVRVDRRTGVSAPEVVGRDAYADVFRAMREAFVTFTLEPVAIRGRRLALVATVGTSPDGFELPYLILVEVDDVGRAVFLAHFDDDNRDGAMQELEDRYVAGEGVDDAYLVRRIGDHRRAYGRRDWAAITELCAPDLVAADHRQLAYPLSGRDSLVAMHQDAVDLVPDLSLEVRTVEVSGDAHLSRTLGRGNSSDGSPVAWECWNTGRWVAGRIATCELFDVTDEAGARARFEEFVATDPRTPTIDNECVRIHERHVWLLARAGDDVSLVAGYDLLAPDVVQIDRRHGVAAPDLVGRDARVENLAAVAATFGDLEVGSIAVRGHRLALVRWTITADGGFHVTGYDVNELDPDGRIARLVTFDESQLRDAVEELETRHRGLVGRPTLAESVYLRNAIAVSRGEVEAMEHAPGYRFVDHSPVGMGGADSAGMVEMASAMLGQVPGVVMYPARLYTSEHVVLAYMPLHGATADGNEYTWEIVVVEVVDRAGRLVADHNFQIEQWDEALALFDERSAGSDQVLDGAELASPAVGTAIAACSPVRLAALDRGDREAVLATYTPDFVREDHRRGVNFGTSNREETVDALLLGNDVGLGERSFTTLEVVDDEHVLVEFRMSHFDGFELVYLLALEADDEGRLRRAANFDPEDRERASALLLEWAAGRDDPQA